MAISNCKLNIEIMIMYVKQLRFKLYRKYIWILSYLIKYKDHTVTDASVWPALDTTLLTKDSVLPHNHTVLTGYNWKFFDALVTFTSSHKLSREVITQLQTNMTSYWISSHSGEIF